MRVAIGTIQAGNDSRPRSASIQRRIAGARGGWFQTRIWGRFGWADFVPGRGIVRRTGWRLRVFVEFVDNHANQHPAATGWSGAREQTFHRFTVVLSRGRSPLRKRSAIVGDFLKIAIHSAAPNLAQAHSIGWLPHGDWPRGNPKLVPLLAGAVIRMAQAAASERLIGSASSRWHHAPTNYFLGKYPV